MSLKSPALKSPVLTRRRLLPAAALVLLAAGSGWWFLQPAADGRQLVTAAASRGNVDDTTTALGTLQPLNYVDVGSQVSGQLKTLRVKIGDHVEAGDLLGELDPTLYVSKVEADKAQLLNLRAQLEERQAQLVLAETQFARQGRMLEASVTSRDAFQSAEASLKAARAQIAQTSAQIRQYESTLSGDEANLGYTRILSPMTGTVVSQTARQGQTLNANQSAPTILRVADLSTMTVWTQVSEADVGKLKLGMKAWFSTLGQPDRKWWGTLRQIMPTPDVTNNVVLYNALFDVDNSDGTLGIQMSAQVFFVHASVQDALVIPVSALAAARELMPPPPGGKRPPAGSPSPAGPAAGDPSAGGRPPVMVMVMENGQPVPRRVTLGVRNRVSAEVLSGLQEGELVVTAVRQPGKVTKAAAGSSGKPPSGMGPPPPP